MPSDFKLLNGSVTLTLVSLKETYTILPKVFSRKPSHACGLEVHARNVFMGIFIYSSRSAFVKPNTDVG